jgi:hypothetical protein
MTRSAQHFERLATDLETNEGMQGIRLKFFGGGKPTDSDGKGATRNEDVSSEAAKEKTELRFKNPFAGMGKSGAAEVDKVQLDSTDGSKNEDLSEEAQTDAAQTPATEMESAAKPSWGNPFVRKPLQGIPASDESQKQAAPVPESNAAVAASEPVESAPPAEGMPTTSVSPTTLQPNPFAMFRQNAGKPKDETTPQAGATQPATEAKPLNNPFKGLGAAFNNSINSTATTTSDIKNSNPDSATSSTTAAKEPTPVPVVPNMLNRNPFARFGGGGGPAKAATEVPKPATTAADNSMGFAGLNSFRKNALARMRSTSDDDAGTEESISFGTPASETSAESKTKPPKMESV